MACPPWISHIVSIIPNTRHFVSSLAQRAPSSVTPAGQTADGSPSSRYSRFVPLAHFPSHAQPRRDPLRLEPPPAPRHHPAAPQNCEPRLH